MNCTFCGHPTLDLDRSYFCPCEDCHKGGALMFKDAKKEPKVFAEVTPQERKTATRRRAGA